MTAVDTELELFPFYCPVEPAIHPEADLVEERAVEWIDRIGLGSDREQRRRVVGTRSAEFYARFAPHGIVANLQAAVHWVYWGFAFDDARCDSGPLSTRPAEFAEMAGRMQRVLEVPHAPPEDGDVFAVALRDIGRQFRECATPTQVRRFNEAHRAWLSGVVQQVGNRARGRMPGLDEYVVQRINSAGGPPTLAMLEIANVAEVPARDMDSLPVRALTEMVCLIAALDNDLHSYQRERDGGHTDQNIVNVHVHHGGSTVAQAMQETVALRDRVMRRFLHVRERVLADAGPALTTYVHGLAHALRGNIDWGLNTPRYTGAENGEPPRDVGVRSPGWATEPSDRSSQPPDIPAISWWWHCFDEA